MSNKMKGILITLVVIIVIVCLYLIFGWHNEKYVKEYKKDGYIYTVSFNQKTYKPGDKLIFRVKVENTGSQKVITGCPGDNLNIDLSIEPSLDLSEVISDSNNDDLFDHSTIRGCTDNYQVLPTADFNPGDVKKSTYSTTVDSFKKDGDFYFMVSILKSEIKIPVKIVS